MRKMVNIDRSALEALELLAKDRKVKLQDLIDEAIADLLKKHRRPVGVREMFAQSLKEPAPKARRGPAQSRLG
jgi:hypothetical protein